MLVHSESVAVLVFQAREALATVVTRETLMHPDPVQAGGPVGPHRVGITLLRGSPVIVLDVHREDRFLSVRVERDALVASGYVQAEDLGRVFRPQPSRFTPTNALIPSGSTF